MKALTPLLLFAAALGAALGVLALCLAVLGRPPGETLLALWDGAFGTKFGRGETLLRAIPVVLCALAAAIPARGGQVNIGVEGQLQLGMVGAALAGLWLAPGPGWVVVGGMVVGGALLGAGWAALPAAFKARLQLNEALVGLFLNYVAVHLLAYLVHGPLRDPASMGWPMSPRVPEAGVLERLPGSRLHTGVFWAFAAAGLAVVALSATRAGAELRAVGLNPAAAAGVGVPVRWYVFGALVAGGAAAGAAGYFEVAGVQHRLRAETSLGLGYAGFLVAWMCRRRLWLLIPMAVVVAGLMSGAETVQLKTGLPASSGDVVQGLLLLFLLAGEAAVVRARRYRDLRQAREGRT